MRKLKEVICHKCDESFLAVRNDARNCKKCNAKRIKDWKNLPSSRLKRLNGYKKLRQFVIDGYGGKCECCNENRSEFLAIDHVNGGGSKERKDMSIAQIIKKVIRNNFPKDYRILCHNCNLAIGFYGYCPHKRTA